MIYIYTHTHIHICTVHLIWLYSISGIMIMGLITIPYLPCFDNVTHWLPLGIPQFQGNSHITNISHVRVQINQYYISTMSNILFKSLQ